MQSPLLTRSLSVVALVFFTSLLLYHGRPLLVPLVFGGLLAMLLLPLSKKMQRWGLPKIPSIILALLTVVIFFGGVIALLSWQVAQMSEDSAKMEKTIMEKVEAGRQFINEKLGVSPQKQEQMMKEQQQSSGSKLSAAITGAVASIGTFLTNFLLVLIYAFLFIYFRSHLKKFILMLVPRQGKARTQELIGESQEVAQKYLVGMMMMIASLWIMYSIGFGIVGVKNFIFFAILCGLLEIIPFVGNLLGNLITIVVALAQGEGTGVVLGILIVYALVQFFQTYVLEPLVVGNEVSINPVFTIAGIVAGEFIWGIPGMILAIPLMGITKIICDGVPVLKPYGFLLGQEKGKEKDGGLKEKLKNLFKGK